MLSRYRLPPIVGAPALRALFWRRKNERLAARLGTVIETCERVRKSFRPPPPRVTIDTSFLDAATKPETVAEPLQPEAATGADAGSELEHATQAQYDVETEPREPTARAGG